MFSKILNFIKFKKKNKTEEAFKKMKKEIHSLENELSSFKKEFNLLNNRIKLLENTIEIGVDVSFIRHNSWAVICLNGKPEYVQFFQLPSNEIREIQQFLKPYSKKAIVDAPPCARIF